MVKRENFGRFLVGEGTGVDERSSLTQRAMGVAALKKRDQPGDTGKSHAKYENLRRERGRLDKKDYQCGSRSEDSQIVDCGKHNRPNENLAVGN